MGLRERKKELTRRQIAEAAWRLFAERGFDRVTVTEIAREAQVGPATVFNYFATKEDLFYSGLDEFGARLVAAVEERPAGEPVIAAVRRFLLGAGGLLDAIAQGDEEALSRARTLHRVISGSASLQAREAQAFTRLSVNLAAAIAGEGGEEVTARVAAGALVGVHRAMVDLTRARVLAGERLPALAEDVRRYGERAFALLGRGLDDYARKPG
ncbi:TetR/AcrR family transcriptional regulator [Nonomuraea typhae]|uniref:TetR/AcrR family transcriptional regulator n=1 Tax=Nonomuraea typhae TaxID=2603600 RepID=UPI0012F7B8AA|nr:TetR/AcrR family transcriptional regulator [Nonomuraea typhae]